MAGKASTYYPNNIKPSIGDTATGNDIGRHNRGIFEWLACPDCGLERWIAKHQKDKLCMSCAAKRRNLVGEKNPRWNGGIRKADGYNYISIPENHPFIKMASRVFVHGKWRYNIAEHRLVMAQYLGRCLEKWELVHHKNGIKDDNRIENLELLQHHIDHLPSMNIQRIVKEHEKRISELLDRVTELEAEIILLKSGSQDSVPLSMNLQHYNTPALNKSEGIVHVQ